MSIPDDTAPQPSVSHDGALFSKTGAEGNDQAWSFGNARNIDSILRIPVLMQVVLGSATMPVANLMKLGRGATVPLDHRVGEPVDIVVNGRVIARGEVVVVEDDNSRFGVSLTEIVGPAGADGA
jgi:flagellar motor switch protein FliN/FliY